jgi:RNA polymerase sigma-70 factor, ECF subfamily
VAAPDRREPGDRRDVRREVFADVVEPPSVPESEGSAASELLAALRALAPEQRAVIVLRHLLGYTPGEIARLLGLPRGTVNSRLRRALDDLAEEVERG